MTSIDLLLSERAKMIAQIAAIQGKVDGIDFAIKVLRELEPPITVNVAETPAEKPAPVSKPSGRAGVSWKPSGTTNADKLLAAIKDIGPDKDGCVPMWGKLQEATGIPKGSIGAAITALEKRGEIVDAANGGRRLKDWPDKALAPRPIKPAPQGEALLPAGRPIIRNGSTASAEANAMIDKFIAQHGVTKCPTAAVAPVPGLQLSANDVAALEDHRSDLAQGSRPKWGNR